MYIADIRGQHKTGREMPGLLFEQACPASSIQPRASIRCKCELDGQRFRDDVIDR